MHDYDYDSHDKHCQPALMTNIYLIMIIAASPTSSHDNHLHLHDYPQPMMMGMNGYATAGIRHHTPAVVYALNDDDLRDNEDDARKQSNEVEHFQVLGLREYLGELL
jgi:hypothetical protein